MCTAITYNANHFYFGRNLDIDRSYNEKITVTPRNYKINFCCEGSLSSHYAIIGMAVISDNYPLYYDAVNECGLCMAGLNFPGNAVYKNISSRKKNVSPYEFILYVLSQYSNIDEVKTALKDIVLVNIPFSDKLPLAELHWIIADKTGVITVEQVDSGLKIYENPVGVLTNNPPFEYHLHNLNNYIHLSSCNTENRFSRKITLKAESQGVSAFGLPGDYSSPSRFVKAAFVKLNSINSQNEYENINQFFHILSSVEMPYGSVRTNNLKYDITVYTSCCDCDSGIYYYKTYTNHQIHGVNLHKTNKDGFKLYSYPLIKYEPFSIQNQ